VALACGPGAAWAANLAWTLNPASQSAPALGRIVQKTSGGTLTQITVNASSGAMSRTNGGSALPVHSSATPAQFTLVCTDGSGGGTNSCTSHTFLVTVSAGSPTGSASLSGFNCSVSGQASVTVGTCNGTTTLTSFTIGSFTGNSPYTVTIKIGTVVNIPASPTRGDATMPFTLLVTKQ
jgi:hypothetical protein